MMELMLARECVTYGNLSHHHVPAQTHAASGGACYVKRPRAQSTLDRHEWVLTASSLHAPEAMLNGQLLRAETQQLGGLPPMHPVVVSAARGHDRVASATVAPLSISFYVFPHARQPACHRDAIVEQDRPEMGPKGSEAAH